MSAAKNIRKIYEMLRAGLAYAALVYAMFELGRIDQLETLHPLFKGLMVLYAAQGIWEILGLLFGKAPQAGEGGGTDIAPLLNEMKKLRKLVDEKVQPTQAPSEKVLTALWQQIKLLNDTLQNIFKLGVNISGSDTGQQRSGRA